MEWNSNRFLKRAILYVLLQVVIFNHIVLWELGFVFLYTLPLLQLNVYRKTQVSHLIITFLMAIIVDYFSNTYGIHSATCVLTMLVRTPVFYVLFNRFLKEVNIVHPIYLGGYTAFFTYISCVFLIYHTAFFILESFTFANFHLTILNILVSTLLTSFTALIFQKLFYPNLA